MEILIDGVPFKDLGKATVTFYPNAVDRFHRDMWPYSSFYGDDFVGCPLEDYENSVYCPVVDEGTDDAKTDSEAPRERNDRDSRCQRRDQDVDPRT